MLKIILILITLIPLPAFSISDRAIFKMGEKIIWGQDVNAHLAMLTWFRCLSPKSPYFSIIKLDSNQSIPKDWKNIFREQSTDTLWPQILVVSLKLCDYLTGLVTEVSSKSYPISECTAMSIVDKKPLELLSKLELFVQSKYPNNEQAMLRFFKILLTGKPHEYIFSVYPK